MIEAFIRSTNNYMVGAPYSSEEGRIATVGRESSGGGSKFNFGSIDHNPSISELVDGSLYTDQIYNALNGTLVAQDEPFADFFPNMSRGAIDSLAAQGDLLAPDDRDDGFPGEVTNGWPHSKRWHDFVEYSPPQVGAQTVSLQTGWNLISTHVAPTNRSLDEIFSDTPEVILVKDEHGQSYIPDYDINTIGDWRDHESYYVYTTSPVDITFTGSSIQETAPIDLESGWAYVAYLPTGSMTPEEAFAPISQELVVAKNDAGDVYFPSEDIDGIESLQPGEGYLLYLNDGATLEYPSSKNASIKPLTTATRDTPRGLFATANVVIPAAHGLDEQQTVIALAGDDMPVGRGTVQNGSLSITIRGDDPQTDRVDGARSGSTVKLYAMSDGERTELDLLENRDAFSGDQRPELTYKRNALIISTLASLPESIKLYGSYPNPARSEATVKYEIPGQSDVRITLYNSLGQRVARLFDGSMQPGTHTIPVNVSQLASGMYFVRLQVGDTTEVQRMAVVK